MKLVAPSRIATILVAAVLVTAIVLVVGHHGKHPGDTHSPTVTPIASGQATPSASPTLKKPKLPPEKDKYPELTARITQFVQLRYSRPAGQTPRELKDTLMASGLTTQGFLQKFVLVVPPAYNTFDAQHVDVQSIVVAGTISGEFSNSSYTTAVETYQVSTFQTQGGKKQYPAQFFESSTWLLVNGQWLVDSTSP